MISYLSGAMEHASDEGAGWRQEMTRWLAENLGHNVIDPVIESRKKVVAEGGEGYRKWKTEDPEKFVNFIKKLVDHDIKLLTGKTDYVICLWDEGVFKGGGTHGEVTIAYHYDIPVYLVNRVSYKDLSGWIQACSTKYFEDFDSLKTFLLGEYGTK